MSVNALPIQVRGQTGMGAMNSAPWVTQNAIGKGNCPNQDRLGKERGGPTGRPFSCANSGGSEGCAGHDFLAALFQPALVFVLVKHGA